MNLPPSEIERIKNNAEGAYPESGMHKDGDKKSRAHQRAYVSGAQAEAVRGREMMVAFLEWKEKNWVAYPNYPGYWAKFNMEGCVVSTDMLANLYILGTQKQKG